MNARRGQRGDDAGLIYEGFTGSKCLTFWYNMRGSGVGALEVWVDDDDVLLLEGSQGNAWKKAEVDITGENSMVSISRIFVIIKPPCRNIWRLINLPKGIYPKNVHKNAKTTTTTTKIYLFTKTEVQSYYTDIYYTVFKLHYCIVYMLYFLQHKKSKRELK